MPGTVGDPNIVSDCEIKKIGLSLYESTSFDISNIGYLLPVQNQWMIQKIDSNTIHSWDVSPSP